MERKQYKTEIAAPREKVWDVLWGESTYPVWVAAFSEGSRAETDWKKGSKALFIGPGEEGMVSEIADNIPNEYMSIRHLGIVKNGTEDTTSEAAREWNGSMENYRLKTVGNKTELTLEMDIAEAYVSYFDTTWPKALENVKKLAEQE